jgi:uncharacterized membrane protein YqgA involved in biofilm formation
MHRFFYENLKNAAPQDLVKLNKDENEHLFKILRAAPGDRVGLIDGAGTAADAVVEEGKMLRIENGVIVSSGAMLLICCLAIGALIGEWLNIEGAFEGFGQWLKIKSGNAKDKGFVNAFVTASLTVCIGAMAIVGSIEDGLTGDYSILATKAVLDLIIIMVMSCSMGKGAVFSAIPVAVFQGSITVMAGLLRPLMTEAALANISLVGNVLIFCVGINLVWDKKVKVANLLPAIVVAVIAAFLPL